jgi:hypothetical protein
MDDLGTSKNIQCNKKGIGYIPAHFVPSVSVKNTLFTNKQNCLIEL